MVLAIGHFLQVFRKAYKASGITELGITIKLHGGLLKKGLTRNDVDLAIYETKPLSHQEAERVAAFIDALKNKLEVPVEDNWNMLVYGPTLTLVDHGILATHILPMMSTGYHQA